MTFLTRLMLFVALHMVFISVAMVQAQARIIWRDGHPVFLDDNRRSNSWAPTVRQNKPRIRRFPTQMRGGPRPDIAPQAPRLVKIRTDYEPGTIIIISNKKTLFYILSDKLVYQYPISVGRRGFEWYGTEKVSRIQDWPSWHPPADMRRRQPGLPIKMEGGISNPLGVKAIYLGKTLYRIHGTNDPKTIGRAASSGCFRMLNAHVVHLAGMVQIGATVIVK